MTSTKARTLPPSPRVADEKVLILDFGSQYAQLIARRVRERQRLLRDRAPLHHRRAHRARSAPRGVILSGGPASVYENAAPKCDPEIFHLGIPVLGICYGMQLACQALGGKVASAPAREYGRAQVSITSPRRPVRRRARRNRRLDEPRRPGGPECRSEFLPLAAHGDLPVRRGASIAACRSTACNFIPKSPTRPLGQKCSANFLNDICGCHGTWRLGDFAEQTVEELRRRVGGDRVICGLSGGVDSSVVAALLYRGHRPATGLHPRR